MIVKNYYKIFCFSKKCYCKIARGSIDKKNLREISNVEGKREKKNFNFGSKEHMVTTCTEEQSAFKCFRERDIVRNCDEKENKNTIYIFLSIFISLLLSYFRHHNKL